MAETLISVYGGMFDSTEIVETVGGFPRGNKAVDSEFFARMIACFWRDGIFGEDSFEVVPGEGMSIEISPGIAWARGYMAWQKQAQSVSVASGKSYTVALRLDLSAGEFSLLVSDDAGFVPQNTDSVRDLVFATVDVPAGVISIGSDNITDKRFDMTLCGVVTSAADSMGVVESAQNSNNLGGEPASSYLKKTGGVMSGVLSAAAEASGACVVRNIGYGTVLPEALGEGELFVLISDT